MLYLVQTFALPLAVAFAGGLAVGWVTSDREDKGPSPWAALAITIFALMVVAAALRWLPGRPGLWLDTAVLFSTAYLAGCIIGAFARAFTDRPEAAAGAPLAAAAAAGHAAPPAEAAVPAAGPPPAASAPPAQRLTGAAAAAEAMAEGTRPEGLPAARGGRPDDLKLIRGIGPQNEARLHALGIWHFDQIAQWTPKEVLWVGGYLAFPGRIEREGWVEQAGELAAGRLTDFAERVRRGEVPTSRDDDPDNGDPDADLGILDESKRPKGLAEPRAGGPDDLTLIRGVGPQIQGKLNALGIWHFDQLAALSEAELNYVSAYAGAPGRAIREDWAGDARSWRREGRQSIPGRSRPAAGRALCPGPAMTRFVDTHVFRSEVFSLGIDRESGGHYLSTPVSGAARAAAFEAWFSRSRTRSIAGSPPIRTWRVRSLKTAGWDGRRPGGSRDAAAGQPQVMKDQVR